MARISVYILVALCVMVALWALTDKSDTPQPTSQLEGGSLRLLSELTDEEIGDLVLPEGAGQVEETVFLSPPPVVSVTSPGETIRISPVPSCLLIGELRNIGDARAIELSLVEKGANTVLVTRIIEELGPYMVYIPPKSTVEQANKTIEALRADRVESIIIRDGPYDKGISLGVFRSEENSAGLVARIRSLGYDVRRRRVTVESELYSLQVSGSALADVEESFWREIRSRYQELTVDEKNCDEVASAGNFQ